MFRPEQVNSFIVLKLFAAVVGVAFAGFFLTSYARSETLIFECRYSIHVGARWTYTDVPLDSGASTIRKGAWVPFSLVTEKDFLLQIADGKIDFRSFSHLLPIPLSDVETWNYVNEELTCKKLYPGSEVSLSCMDSSGLHAIFNAEEKAGAFSSISSAQFGDDMFRGVRRAQDPIALNTFDCQ
jgi:hypothetical protein